MYVAHCLAVRTGTIQTLALTSNMSQYILVVINAELHAAYMYSCALLQLSGMLSTLIIH